jgi:hypothetical protein
MAGFCDHGNETSGSTECREFILAEELLASQEGLRCRELLS